jgi:hypothetical protein
MNQQPEAFVFAFIVGAAVCALAVWMVAMLYEMAT